MSQVFVVVGTFEARVGRPKSPICRRGHIRQRQPNETYCKECKKEKDRLRYQSNPELRQRKRDYQRTYRAEFKQEFGFGLHKL
jgi:hypothetical protein